MPAKILITKTFEWWTEARRALPAILSDGGKSSILTTIWKVTRVTPYRWGANRRTNEDWSHNPHDLLTTTHHELAETGNRWLIESSLRLLAEPFDFAVKDNTTTSDKAAPVLELLDIQEALGRLSAEHRDHLADNRYTGDERARDIALLNEVMRQAEEMKAAIRQGGE